MIWEIQKFIKQRAFDHQLDWYIRVIRSLAGCQYQMVKFYEADAVSEAELKTTLYNKLSETMENFRDDVREGFLFASPSTLAILSQMNSNLQAAMMNRFVTSDEDSRDAAIHDISFVFTKAYRSLSDEVREHLATEKLSEDLLSLDDSPSSVKLRPIH